jgi:hypothetical protein
MVILSITPVVILSVTTVVILSITSVVILSEAKDLLLPKRVTQEQTLGACAPPDDTRE